MWEIRTKDYGSFLVDSFAFKREAEVIVLREKFTRNTTINERDWLWLWLKKKEIKYEKPDIRDSCILPIDQFLSASRKEGRFPEGTT